MGSNKDWPKQRCLTYTIEHSPAMKKKEIVLFSEKWIELEITRASKKTRPRRQALHVFSHVWNHTYTPVDDMKIEEETMKERGERRWGREREVGSDYR